MVKAFDIFEHGRSTFCDIEVEKVTIQGSLNTSGNYGNPVVELLHVEPVNPIYDIEATVKAESKQVVRGDGLSLPRLRNHVELRHDSYTLKVDRECPQDL